MVVQVVVVCVCVCVCVLGGGGGWVHAVLYCVLNPSPSPVKTFQTQLVLLIFKDSQDFSRFFCAVLNIIDQKRG